MRVCPRFHTCMRANSSLNLSLHVYKCSGAWTHCSQRLSIDKDSETEATFRLHISAIQSSEAGLSDLLPSGCVAAGRLRSPSFTVRAVRLSLYSGRQVRSARPKDGVGCVRQTVLMDRSDRIPASVCLSVAGGPASASAVGNKRFSRTYALVIRRLTDVNKRFALKDQADHPHTHPPQSDPPRTFCVEQAGLIHLVCEPLEGEALDPLLGCVHLWPGSSPPLGSQARCVGLNPDPPLGSPCEV